jgi:hypothetical protein
MASRVMSIAEIDTAFNKLTTDNSMRSLSAVLRIGAEQIERRGKLGIVRNLVFVTALIALVCVFAVPFVPAKVKASLAIWEYVSVGVCVISVIFLFRVRGKLEQYLDEEKQIRGKMIEAAQKIAGVPTFNPTPLSEELRGTLKDALRHHHGKGVEELQEISERL